MLPLSFQLHLFNFTHEAGNHLLSSHLNNGETPPLLLSELKTAIFSLKKSSSPGADGITSKHILALLDEIITPLRVIIESCIDLAYFPQPWKKALVLTIPKRNRPDLADPSSYRPISLLPVMGKVLEKVLLKRLLYTANKLDWCPNNQHGFRTGFSTVTALRTLTDQIKRGFAKKANTVCVFLDIKGAFDNAQHSTIIQNLQKSNCPAYLTKLIASFLNNRKAELRLEDSRLSVDISQGCPQGSTLSPLLWNIVINDVLKINLPSGMKIQAFADDLVISLTGINKSHMEASIQKACDDTINWGKSVHLTFSSQKTELMVFSRKHNPVSGFKLTINGLNIAQRNKVKYLGVLLDPKLTFAVHIEEKCLKAKQKIAELRHFSKTTWGKNNKRVLLHLYKAIIDPMLLYAVPIWVDATLLNWCKAKLRSVQRLMLNSSIGSFRSTSSKSALILTNETPIEMRAQELAVISSLKGYQSSSKIVKNIFANIDINILNIDFPCPSFHSSHPPFEPSPALTINTTANYPSLLPNSENEFYVFTDGSKSDAGVGCAVVVTDSTAILHIHKIRLPQFSGIFEAEAYAIKYALSSIRQYHSPGRKFSIFSDSRSVLMAISSPSKTIPIIRKIQKRTFSLLQQSINIQFHWVPGHKNIHGNELADKAARAAVNSPINTIHNIKIPWSHCKPLLKEYFQTLWNTEWAHVDSDNITKSFFPSPTSAGILKSIHLSRQLVQVLSGHSKLRSFLHRIGVESEGTCPCRANIETTQHFLFDCHLYHSLRKPILHSCRNIPWPPPLHFFTSSTQKLTLLKSFIHKTNRL